MSAVLAAMLGLSILLLTGVLTWKECLEYAAAWDTLFWFAVLVGAPLAGFEPGTFHGSPSACKSCAPMSHLSDGLRSASTRQTMQCRDGNKRGVQPIVHTLCV